MRINYRIDAHLSIEINDHRICYTPLLLDFYPSSQNIGNHLRFSFSHLFCSQSFVILVLAEFCSFPYPRVFLVAMFFSRNPVVVYFSTASLPYPLLNGSNLFVVYYGIFSFFFNYQPHLTSQYSLKCSLLSFTFVVILLLLLFPLFHFHSLVELGREVIRTSLIEHLEPKIHCHPVFERLIEILK